MIGLDLALGVLGCAVVVLVYVLVGLCVGVCILGLWVGLRLLFVVVASYACGGLRLWVCVAYVGLWFSVMLLGG